MPSALILAGGRGRRLGRPKAGVMVAGATLVERAVANVGHAGCSPIRVISSAGVELPELEGAEVLLDDVPGGGPLAAVACGLRGLSDDTDVIVLACDLPNASAVLMRLVELPPGMAAVAVDPDGRDQPLCARYPAGPARAAAATLIAAGDRRMRSLVGAVHATRIEATAQELSNINEQEDLDALVAALTRQDRARP